LLLSRHIHAKTQRVNASTQTNSKRILRKQKQASPKPGLEELKKVMGMLAEDKRLPPEKKDHPLKGNWAGYHECLVQPDFSL
jgi:mRNA interferase YafQ